MMSGKSLIPYLAKVIKMLPPRAARARACLADAADAWLVDHGDDAWLAENAV